MIKYILIVFLFPVVVFAQDNHYSHFQLTPLYLNPALTGGDEPGQRIGGSYRSQWSEIPEPYTSYNLFYDKNKGPFKWGLLLNQNSAGEASLKTTNVLFSGAFRKQLSELTPNYLAIGGQVGIAQKRFDPTLFAFDNQYSSSTGFDPSNSNNETFNRTVAIVPDLQVGAIWNFGLANAAEAQVGISFAHLTQPTSSFYYASQMSYPLRTTVHGQVLLPISLKMTLNPKILWMQQNPAQELIFGASANYQVDNNTIIGVGLLTRQLDAFIIQGHLKYQNITVGIGYDTNVSSLQPSTNGNGAFELNVIYTLGKIQGQPRIDTDGDGIIDSKDKCPLVPGVPALKGCPIKDTDGDGIVDNKDKCPTVPGVLALQGCPQQNEADTDGDGILDKDDLCPTVIGLLALKGCPQNNDLKDSDGDGITDNIDLCPFQPGTMTNQGCNDMDNDGVWDHIDICPRIFGEKTNNGCPNNNQNLDSDGDGILDKVDKCVYLRGSIKYGGCPDSDKDGVSDIEDDCPFIKGGITTNGCPDNETPTSVINPQEIKTLIVEFDTDRSFIRPYYYKELDDMAYTLRSNVNYRIILSGHTDSEGNEAYNYQLSNRRTQAVHDYLVSRGVLPSRIEQRSYGEVIPKSSNTSAEGKQRNRRTEIIIIN